MPEAAAPEIWGLSTEVIGIWIAAFLTLAIYSFLYQDNPVYKFVEHIFVGISAGYGVVITYHEAVIPLLIDPLFRPERAQMAEPNYLVIIPGILGMMMFSRFFPKYDWISRWPIAFVMGVYSGLSIPAAVQTQLLPQLSATMLPVLPEEFPPLQTNVGFWLTLGAGLALMLPAAVGLVVTHLRDSDPRWRWPLLGLLMVGIALCVGAFLTDVGVWTAFSNLLLVVGVLCTLAYFYFSREHVGSFGVASKVGIFFLMIAFGASFGNTVMARVSLLIGRVQFLYHDWWGPHVWQPIMEFFAG